MKERKMKRRALILREGTIESCKEIALFLRTGRRKTTRAVSGGSCEPPSMYLSNAEPVHSARTAAADADDVFLHFLPNEKKFLRQN